MNRIHSLFTEIIARIIQQYCTIYKQLSNEEKLFKDESIFKISIRKFLLKRFTIFTTEIVTINDWPSSNVLTEIEDILTQIKKTNPVYAKTNYYVVIIHSFLTLCLQLFAIVELWG